MRSIRALAFLLSMYLHFYLSRALSRHSLASACDYAQVLEPNRFLPKGAAVVTVCVTAMTTHKELTVCAERFQKRLSAAFNLTLQHKLQLAKQESGRIGSRLHADRNAGLMPRLWRDPKICTVRL